MIEIGHCRRGYGILAVKVYNERYPARKALLSDGKERKTGYVLIDASTDKHLWFRNFEQAKLHITEPGKWGKRWVEL